jgi:transposase
MPKSLSTDLRNRVVAAVGAGASRREAAARFGVSAASAVRWVALAHRQGDARPKRQGGDRRSHRIEDHGELILALVRETPDMTLVELRTELAERGISAAVSTIWRFLDRCAMTLKKRRRTPPSRIGPTS